MLVIIHGWSDNARSFTALGRTLIAQGVAQQVVNVRLGDYVSLDDNVSFDDLSEALQAAWKKEGLPTSPRSVDVVVHSTGGLVIRHWMTRFYKAGKSPIYRLLMLAPANFGSPLAHKGRSFMGRIVKGYKSDRLFETGTQILNGLELASPFARGLAMKDLFVAADESWYGPGRILCTVMVGTTGYSGISAAANEDGTDGTVRVSTANLNALHVTLDFAADPQAPTLKVNPSTGMIAFARIPGENHSTIALKDGGPRNQDTVAMIVEALKVKDDDFDEWTDRLKAFSAIALSEADADDFDSGYQNTVVHLSDQYGTDVRDFFLELFAKTDTGNPDNELTALIQNDVINTVHTYEENPAHRSLLLNTGLIESKLTGIGKAVYLSLTAMPEISKTGTVGYSTFGYDDIGSIKLVPEKARVVFQPDRTVLVDIIIRREQREKVFRLLPLE